VAVSTFIETRAGYISSDRVVRIAQLWTNAEPKGMRTEIEYLNAGGEARVTTATDPNFDPLRMTPPIPSAPGYFTVTMLEDGTVCRMPVLAWRIAPGALSAEPICPDEPFGWWAILCPDGAVISPYEAIHASLDAWKAAMLENLREIVEERAKQGAT
jgi:hypothetical protein